MQAELFYTVNHPKPVPLYFVAQTQWEEHLETLTPVKRRHFAQIQFSGKIGDYCLFHNTEAQLEKAYIGIGDGN